MLTGFVAQQISRANRNLIILNAVILAIVAVITVVMVPYIVECVRGPFVMTVPEVGKLGSLADAPHRFVSIDIPKGRVDRQTYYIKGGSDHKHDNFYFWHVDQNRYVIIRSNADEPPAHVVGTLAGLNSDVTDSVIPGVTGDVVGSAAPVMIDEQDYRFGLYLLAIIGGFFALLGVWNVLKGIRRMSDPLKHPLAKMLAKVGPVEEMAIAVDAEMQAGSQRVGKVLTTQSWLFRQAMLGGTIVYLGDVAWAYQKTTTHRTNGIKTGTSYGMVLHDVRGKRTEFVLSQQQVQTLLVDLGQRVPWVVVGFSKEIETGWNKDRAAFLEKVARRKKEIVEGVASAPPAPPPVVT